MSRTFLFTACIYCIVRHSYECCQTSDFSFFQGFLNRSNNASRTAPVIFFTRQMAVATSNHRLHSKISCKLPSQFKRPNSPIKSKVVIPGLKKVKKKEP